MLLWVLILFAYFLENDEEKAILSFMFYLLVQKNAKFIQIRANLLLGLLRICTQDFFFFSFFGELLLFLAIGASESENRRIFELALMLKSINLDHCCLKSLFEEMSFLVLWNFYLTIYHTFHVNGNFSYLALQQNLMIIFVCFNRSSIVG